MSIVRLSGRKRRCKPISGRLKRKIGSFGRKWIL
uniref:Uncharacterized protein n=1 Tax=Siphoviridae sp. ctVzN31 TaxID=2825534 RepID=A0A8S5NXS7_9CAUD|nr:MAG TPA: hypothetical protein [Siphoviridae sp. ctVzN31]